jgi:ribosomal protein S18 acetylase RimI-like enzyme
VSIVIPLGLRWLTAADRDLVVSAEDLFDGPVRAEAVRSFLADPRHHLCLAFLEDRAVGFVTGVEMIHPDKGTEMFLYELGVDDAMQRRGIGTALVRALAERAREIGCHSMWVLTEEDNEAAVRTYLAGGAGERSSEVMLSWTFEPGDP